MKFNALVVLLVAFASSAHAQGRAQPVAAEQSRFLVLLPHLEKAPVSYTDSGWNEKGSQRTARASVAVAGTDFPRAEITHHLMGPGSGWSNGARLDAAFIRAAAPFFNGRDIKYEGKASINANRAIRYLRFASGGAHCMAFEVQLTPNEGATGVYCPPPGTALTDTVINQVQEGIYVRRNGRIERGIPDIKKPLPGGLPGA